MTNYNNENETSSDLVGITLEEIHRAADEVANAVLRTIDESDADVVCLRCGEEMGWGDEYQLDTGDDKEALCPGCHQFDNAENGVRDRDAFRENVVDAIAEIQEYSSTLLAMADRRDYETRFIKETDEYRVLAGEVIEAFETYVNGMFDMGVGRAARQAFADAGQRLVEEADTELPYFVLPPRSDAS